jgi:hypothetical protein
MSEETSSIGRDYDPGGDRLSADSDPREAFLTYLDEKHADNLL